MKVNVEAAWKEGRAGVSMVVRDEAGKMIFFEDFNFKGGFGCACRSFLALAWASEYGEFCRWTNIEWSSDATKAVVEGIISYKESSAWDLRNFILAVQKRFQSFNWKLSWCNRSTNKVADATAKLGDSSFVFDDFFFLKTSF